VSRRWGVPSPKNAIAFIRELSRALDRFETKSLTKTEEFLEERCPFNFLCHNEINIRGHLEHFRNEINF
jgi:hypothetical protein